MTLFILNTRRRRLQFINGGRNFRLSGLEFIIIPNGQTIDEIPARMTGVGFFRLTNLWNQSKQKQNSIFLTVMRWIVPYDHEIWNMCICVPCMHVKVAVCLIVFNECDRSGHRHRRYLRTVQISPKLFDLEHADDAVIFAESYEEV